MRPPKSLMGRNSFLFFVWFTHMWALWLFSSIQYYCSMVAIYYDVRSSHIVSIRTCHFSKQQQQPVRVKWEETSYYIPGIRVAVYQSITMRRRMIRVGALMYFVWPLIGSKFAKNSWKLDKVDKTRCTWPFQAKNRYDVTLANRRAPGVWFVLGFRTYVFLAPRWPGIPVLAKKTKWT